MTDVKFLDELKSKLVEYGKIDTEIKRLTEFKNTLRNQFDSWMKMNQMGIFETTDSAGQLWQLQYNTRTNKKTNWALIKQLVPPERHDELIEVSKSNIFLTIRELKQRSKQYTTTKQMEAPVSNG